VKLKEKDKFNKEYREKKEELEQILRIYYHGPKRTEETVEQILNLFKEWRGEKG
jgi:hypothetical protein